MIGVGVDRDPLPGPGESDGLALGLLYLLLTARDWIHRRVERIELVDERRARSRVSIDMSLAPGGEVAPGPVPGLSAQASGFLAPVALLGREFAPLRAFDLRDEASAALPLWTKAQTRAAVIDSLQVYLARIKGGLDDSAAATGAALIAQVAGTADSGPDEHEVNALSEVAGGKGFVELCATLSSAYPLLVPSEAGRRRIIKYSHDAMIQPAPASAGEHRRWRVRESAGRAARRLGLRPVTYRLLRNVGDAQSSHFEVPAPEGLVIDRARLQRVNDSGDPIGAPLHEDRRTSLAHVYVADEDTARVVLDLHLRLRRGGLLALALVAATLTFVTLLAGLLADRILGLDQMGDAAPGLLAALPGLVGLLVAEQSRHRLFSAMVSGIRALILISSLVSFTAAASLAISTDQRQELWWVLLVVSGAVLAPITVAYAKAIHPTGSGPTPVLP